MTKALRICFLIWVTPGLIFSLNTQGASSSDNEEFWKSVYEDNRVLNIEISITDENWRAMQPTPPQSGRNKFPKRRSTIQRQLLIQFQLSRIQAPFQNRYESLRQRSKTSWPNQTEPIQRLPRCQLYEGKTGL